MPRMPRVEYAGAIYYVTVRMAGLTQRKTAAVLGLKTGAAVGQQLQRLRQRLKADARLRHQQENLETALIESR